MSFHVGTGEILALAGVAGNRQDELFALLAGLSQATAGKITIKGVLTAGLSPYHVARLGVGDVPSDRFGDGLVPDFSIAENVILGQQWERRWRTGHFSNLAAISAAGERAIETYNIAAVSPAVASRRCQAATRSRSFSRESSPRRGDFSRAISRPAASMSV